MEAECIHTLNVETQVGAVHGCWRTKPIQHTKTTGHNLYNAKDLLVGGSCYSHIWQRDFDPLRQRFLFLDFFWHPLLQQHLGEGSRFGFSSRLDCSDRNKSSFWRCI